MAQKEDKIPLQHWETDTKFRFSALLVTQSTQQNELNG